MMKVYDEALVNSYTADYQYAPAVSQLTGGGYVVTWVSRGQDGNADGIYAQRFSASGIPAGPEFRVNSNVIGNQVEPTVVGLSDGSFAVVWTDQSGLDGSSYGVYGGAGEQAIRRWWCKFPVQSRRWLRECRRVRARRGVDGHFHRLVGHQR